MNRILIIANFCRPFDGTLNGRFLYLSEMLANEGYDVELITSDFSHTSKMKKSIPIQSAYKSKLTYCHEPGYIKHASLKRLWSHYVWGINVMRYIKNLQKPDLIYCAIPSLTAAVKLSAFCQKHKIKFAVDVQDLWPEATFMLIRNKLIRKCLILMKLYVDKAYSRADYVIAVSNSYIHRILLVNHKFSKSLAVYLGNDGLMFDNSVLKYKNVRNDNEIWLGYVGSLSFSYDIDCVIDALYLLKHRNSINQPIKFILCGDGPMREKFERYAIEKDVDCIFYGRLPYEQMVGRLCMCDIVINPIVKGSAASIINKVGDYALSGLPVINTQECQEYRKLIDSYRCGINCDVSNSKQVANAIEKLVLDPKLRYTMGMASRKLGEEQFDRRNTYKKIIELITTN